MWPGSDWSGENITPILLYLTTLNYPVLPLYYLLFYQCVDVQFCQLNIIITLVMFLCCDCDVMSVVSGDRC